MKQRPLLCVGLFWALALGVFTGSPALAQAPVRIAAGNLAGIVRDSAGIPQLGATVELLSETAGLASARQFLTNTQGAFQGDKIAPGFYTVRVTLAGFLPSLEKHVQISANITTTLRIQLESMFASLEEMRRPPVNNPVESDDWKWVLRSAPGLRPVLQWTDDQESGSTSVVVMEGAPSRQRGARRAKAMSSRGW